MRVQSLIENDRLSVFQNFEELIVSDLHKLLLDYFDYRGLPSVTMEKVKDKLKVNIEITATSVKQFSTLPKN